MVRILCLHGQGVNAEIFRKQTAAMRDMLPDEYEFVFFDGGHECEPAPEVADAYAPPFKTWYNTPTTTKVTDAHRQVRSIISEHGPFDAVLGFSQGAAVAASMLMHDDLDNKPPTFRAAVFIGSPIPFSYRTDVGIDARLYFGVPLSPPNEHGRPTKIPEQLVTDPAYLRNPAQLGDGAEAFLYQMFQSDCDSARIRVPTGHVIGSRDKWCLHSKELVALCSADKRHVFTHDGGHEIPRGYTEELCDLVETVFGGL